MNRTKRNLLMVAIALGISLCGCATIEALTTPRYSLSNEQHSSLNKTARLGYYGLDEFNMTVEYPHGVWPGARSFSDSVIQPVKMGDSFKSIDIIEDNSFTPTIHDDGTYVTYHMGFSNLANDTTETAVFRNPDTKLFGTDGQVSVDEMRMFFKDSRTELVSLDYDAKDEVWGKCTIKLSFDGNTLITDAADMCKHYVSHSSTDGLLEDLEGLWYSPITEGA